MKTNFIHKTLSVLMMSAMLFTVSCEKKDKVDPQNPIDQGGTEPPIELGCQFFTQNPNTVLVNNPKAPIDYIVTCRLTIGDDVTIEPGVTIAFEADNGFWVNNNGSLKAVGTSDQPITFTGVNKERGSWGGIYFSSNNPKNEMNHTIFEYAGGRAVSSMSEQKGGVVIGSGASLKFQNNLVQHCKNWGLSLYYSANDETTIIENNTFNANERPLQVTMNFVGLVKGNNVFTNNTSNKAEILTQYAIAKTQTLHKLNVPYWIRGPFHFEIGFEGNLTIEPGTVIEMADEKNIVVKGSLIMNGTSSEKIIIRGVSAAPGSWGNIVYHSASPNNQINYTEIRHAGAKPNGYYLNKGAVSLGSNARLQIDNTHFQDIFSCLLFRSNPSVLTWGENITSNNVNVAGLENCEY